VAIYLGLDSSTQSLTATAIEVTDNTRRIVCTRSFRFEDVLPQYGTRHGVLPSADPTVVHAPPIMWAEALERMFSELTHERVDWNKLRAISGSAQQHGSVYLNANARQMLQRLDGSLHLKEQLADVFSRSTSPIWMDSSTTAQCVAIEEALGGPPAVARLTGSRAYERFTAPQIRKFAEQDPTAYAVTDRIHLVSSWLASLLAGVHAPIDHGDGSGMNLMDLGTRKWAADALRATAPDLGAKLPELAESWKVVGRLASFWRRKYDLPAARIVAWSGDNPCSLIGTGLVREGLVAVSLGTSDTIFALMCKPTVSADGTGHVFVSPTGDYMGMTVFKNGSLARERLRDKYRLDWAAFSDALRTTAAGNHGMTMMPWFVPEITPLVLTAGVRRHALDPADTASNVRALVEGQMMALRLHSRWMGVQITTVHATGGAAQNREMLQVLADVFDADVYQLPAANSAALGAALRAFHADCVADERPIEWNEVVSVFAEPLPNSRIAPIPANVATYRRQIEVYAEREREALASA
jgi:xylulokinase